MVNRSPSIRPRLACDALQRAVYAVADLMTVDIAVSGERFVCRLFARTRCGNRTRTSLRAEVIDQTLRLRIAAQTEPLRNLVFALAFSRTGLLTPGIRRNDGPTIPLCVAIERASGNSSRCGSIVSATTDPADQPRR